MIILSVSHQRVLLQSSYRVISVGLTSEHEGGLALVMSSFLSLLCFGLMGAGSAVGQLPNAHDGFQRDIFSYLSLQSVSIMTGKVLTVCQHAISADGRNQSWLIGRGTSETFCKVSQNGRAYKEMQIIVDSRVDYTTITRHIPVDELEG